MGGLEVGMDMKEEWWLLDETDDYKQIYYCTTDQKVVPGNQLEGGLILSKTSMLIALRRSSKKMRVLTIANSAPTTTHAPQAPQRRLRAQRWSSECAVCA